MQALCYFLKSMVEIFDNTCMCLQDISLFSCLWCFQKIEKKVAKNVILWKRIYYMCYFIFLEK